ncbi:hypothetical protein C4553_01975 [Candidatus Parcubacteria bacterium]|nr:MAG: hypothetical protein C4553_01975 [Candidatus Parcubacteria bacterium]
MAFWDFAKKPKFGGPHVIVLDFGSGSVKAVVVSLDEVKKIGYVIGIGREYYNQQQGASNFRGIEGGIEVAKKAINQALTAARAKTSECIVVYNGDTLKGVLHVWKERRQNPQERIYDAEFQGILERALKNASENAVAKDLSVFKPVIASAALQRLEIDGYHVVNPIGFKGAEIEVKLLVFYLASGQKGFFDEIVGVLKLSARGLVSSVFATTLAQMKHSLTQFGAIVIDIGQTNTDVIVARDSIIEGIQSAQIGGKAITEGIMETFSLSFEEAVQKKIQYELGELDQVETRKLENGIRGRVELLRDSVVQALKGFSETAGGFPEKVFLCGGGIRVSLVKKMFSQNSWLVGLPFPKQPSIEVLLPSDIKDVIDSTESLEGPSAVPLLSAVRWLTRNYNISSQADIILRKALQVFNQSGKQ